MWDMSSTSIPWQPQWLQGQQANEKQWLSRVFRIHKGNNCKLTKVTQGLSQDSILKVPLSHEQQLQQSDETHGSSHEFRPSCSHGYIAVTATT